MGSKLGSLVAEYTPVIVQTAAVVVIVGMVYKTFLKGNTLYGEGKDSNGKAKKVKLARKTDLGYQLYNPKTKKYEGRTYKTQKQAQDAWNKKFASNGYKVKD